MLCFDITFVCFPENFLNLLFETSVDTFFYEKNALDILQPDIYWAGGLSEVIKIANLASTYDLITIPHGHSSNATLHFSLSQVPIHNPYQEYLIKWNKVHQHFLKTPEKPIKGFFRETNFNDMIKLLIRDLSDGISK